MARSYKTISGLTYGDMESALFRLGYERKDEPRQVVYRHPIEKQARLVFRLFDRNEEVRGIDFVTTRAIVDGFGLTDAKDFELLLFGDAGARAAVASQV